ncbi:hypothetical protein [Myxococcus phage Mx4 ts27htf-1hrm-1]|nr:hypothetical protein Mx4_p48 [Myxococcus phage Mx4]WNM70387.1 hypothetical protein [Myxococcus phage Mx4 ts27htf-1hrm-1]
MALEQAHLRVAITLADGADGAKEPPKEFRIFAAGINDTSKGPFVFDELAAREVMARYQEAGNDLCVDYNHGMADGWPIDPSLSGKAAGWFKPEMRGGELWASQVEWTPAARAALAAREWRYMSPWFCFDGETRRICQLVNVALTNTPATKNLTPLVASRHRDNPVEPEMNLNPKLLALLGLSATATEAEVLSALTTRNAASEAQNAQVAEVLSLTGKATLSEALGVAKAWKASADALPAVQAELANLKAVANDAKLSSLLDEAVKGGKLAPSARPAFETLGRKDLPQFEAMLSAMPVILPGAGGTGPKPPQGAPDTATLSADEKIAAKAAGISEADFLKFKTEQGAKAA